MTENVEHITDFCFTWPLTQFKVGNVKQLSVLVYNLNDIVHVVAKLIHINVTLNKFATSTTKVCGTANIFDISYIFFWLR